MISKHRLGFGWLCVEEIELRYPDAAGTDS